jgi:mannose-6-phosphate isomerase-like protein (cupin superfamily)
MGQNGRTETYEIKSHIMNIWEYIESGILVEYVMGWLSPDQQEAVYKTSLRHPEIARELRIIERHLEKLALQNAVEPEENVKIKILEALGFSTYLPILDLHNLPVISEEANHLQWLDALKHLIPEIPTENFTAIALRNDQHLTQTLVITKSDVPEETHGDLIESFFILKGGCICSVGKETHHLHAGSFLEIPLHTEHTIKIVTPYVVGILQHRMLEI